MKAYFLTLCFTLAYLLGYGQSSAQDLISTQNGDLKIQPILHGSLVMEWSGEVIYNDPYGGAEAFAGKPDPTIILITDIHGDHLNLETLEAINTSSATFVVPQAVADQLPEAFKNNLIVIGNGETKTVKNIAIEALPMYNLPESPDSRHTKGRGNGYILNLGGKNIYISGDTEDIPEMRALENIDVAFVCMNLPYTMDVDQAASAVLDFKPKIVYPFHYRGQGGLSDVASFKDQVNAADETIEVRLRNWYPEKN